MSVTLRPYGILKSYIADQKETTVKAGLTVREAMTAVGIPPDVVAGVFVNDEQQSKEYVLQEGDIVKLLAVIGGG